MASASSDDDDEDDFRRNSNSVESSRSEEEEDWDDEEDGDDSSDDNDNDNDNLVTTTTTTSSSRRRRDRSLLWLCQEGQIRLARRRFNLLFTRQNQNNNDNHNHNGDNNNNNSDDDQLNREVFQVGRDKNTALLELLMGGTSDHNAYVLTCQLLDYIMSRRRQQKNPNEVITILSLQPRSYNQRTPLHWAAWGNAKMEILKPLVRGYPEALVLRDDKRSGSRTPCEILKHYYFDSSSRYSNQLEQQQQQQLNEDSSSNNNDNNIMRLEYLEKATKSWTQHRLRRTVHLCTLRYFKTLNLTPFDKNDRKQLEMKPKPWFVLSILGTLVQREMKPLLFHILGLVGANAKIATTTRTNTKAKTKTITNKKTRTNTKAKTTVNRQGKKRKAKNMDHTRSVKRKT